MLELSRGTITGPEDLDIQTVDNAGTPIDPHSITYALYDYTTGVEVLIGPSERLPVRDELGHYYAAFQVPENANYGTYRIRWSIEEQAGDPAVTVMEEFAVVEASALQSKLYSGIEQEMIGRLRRLLRDQNPDKYYHFRPPTSSGTVNEYNRVFAHIWENDELIEYMEQAMFSINAHPPETHFRDLDHMLQGKPNWRHWVLTGAIAHACVALSLNWIADEFSICHDEKVTVLLPDGEEVEVPIGELYQICHD